MIDVTLEKDEVDRRIDSNWERQKSRRPVTNLNK